MLALLSMPISSRAKLFGAAIAVAATYATISAAAAYDPQLDQAEDFLVKGQALVNAASEPRARVPFGGHTAKASALIDQAIAELELAKKIKPQ